MQAKLAQRGDLAEDVVGPLVLGQCMAVSQVQIRKFSEAFRQQTEEQLVRFSKYGTHEHYLGAGVLGQLTLRKGLKTDAVLQVEVLEVLQLPEAFGQQTGEQLVRFPNMEHTSTRQM